MPVSHRQGRPLAISDDPYVRDRRMVKKDLLAQLCGHHLPLPEQRQPKTITVYFYLVHIASHLYDALHQRSVSGGR